MISEKSELETKLKSTGPGTGTGSDSARIRLLEKELEQKTQLNAKYEQQIAELKGGPKMGGIKRGGVGPVLSRTGSVERNVEDQLLKDLQVSISSSTFYMSSFCIYKIRMILLAQVQGAVWLGIEHKS